MELRESLLRHKPYNEQEEADIAEIIRQIDSGADLYTRDNRQAHLTASAWIVSPDHRKVLLAYHNIYRSWSWLGGHADGDHDLLHVAVKEVLEESGLPSVRTSGDDIYSAEILTVDGHIKNGSYVSSHLHLNVTYLMEADTDLPLMVKPDENSGVAWFDISHVQDAVSERWMAEHIYRKLNAMLEMKTQ